jgi:hypothetical protein
MSIPSPHFQIGQRIETREVCDDTKLLMIERGIIRAMTYTTDTKSSELEPGWNYHIYFDYPRHFETVAHESGMSASSEA